MSPVPELFVGSRQQVRHLIDGCEVHLVHFGVGRGVSNLIQADAPFTLKKSQLQHHAALPRLHTCRILPQSVPQLLEAGLPFPQESELVTAVLADSSDQVRSEILCSIQ